MRFYNVDSGEILLDGVNIHDISCPSLRDSIGIVLQDTVLFSDTVRANLTYGASLSQGERQLIAIGRAFLSDPQILILDEATSNVDTRTEKNIQDAMLSIMKGRTLRRFYPQVQASA